VAGDLVELTTRDRTAVLTLRRPDRLNTLTDALLADFAAALDAAEAGKHRAVVVTGAGRGFCAGADLAVLLDRLADAEGVRAFVRRAGAVFDRLENSPLPVIAAVNGVAVAGGFELVLACDAVVAAAGVPMGDGHVRYGVLPGGGGAVRLPRKVPANVARRLLFTGDLEPAERFRDWGLVDRVVPAAELLDAALDLAARFAAASPLGLAELKRLLSTAADLPLPAALAAEQAAFARYADGPDLRTGLTAFREHRRPRFD
jgi:enoyl-CoA hydratase/carnithine racemase